jgi:hypothetical protein
MLWAVSDRICITVQQVNDALAEALSSSYYKNQKYETIVEEYGNIADILHETTLILAKK